MTEPAELRKQKYARFTELFAIARKRYLEAGGDPHRSSGSLHGNDYLTDEERKELSELGRELGGIRIMDGYVYCEGKSWPLPVKSKETINEDAAKCES